MYFNQQHTINLRAVAAFGAAAIIILIYIVLQTFTARPMYQHEDNGGFLRSINIQQTNW